MSESSRRAVRKLIIGLVAIAALITVLLVMGIIYLRSALPERDGRLDLPGLASTVEVLWDPYGVPHLWAASIEDAVFAQGYLHANDRLWQMELIRMAIQGRLAEIMGAEALGTDRFMRRLGLWRSTAETEAALGPEERRLLGQYAAGVNAALESWSGAWPPEFLALRHEPEPWTTRHTLAVARMMSFTLSSYSEAVSVARAVRRLGEDRARHLFPPFPEWGATILGTPAPEEPPPLAAALIDAYSVAAASNSWVLSGRLSRSGKPLLANDPHLGLQAPNIWYLMGMHAPGEHALDVVGVSLPGAPLIILGHNRAIAWGMTNAYVDDADLFLERVDPADPARYLVPGGSEPFEVVAETISVKGWDAPEILRLRRTRHGPVVPLTDSADGGHVLAVEWTALRPSSVVRSVLGMNLAHDWPSFTAAVDLMDDPHQNLVYADTAGHIGFYMGGTVPIRGDRRPAPTAPVPGWTGEWDWRGALPFEEHPHVLDPAAGFIVTANNRQTAEPVAELISGTWQEPFRAMRIEEMIRAGRDHDADAMLAMQMDVADALADRWVERAVEAAEWAGLEETAALLEDWDLRAAPDSRAATLFYAWYEILRRAAARDLYGGDPGYFPRGSADVLLETRAVPWRDGGGEAYAALATQAMREAVSLAGGRTWSEGNRVVHEHALGGVALLDRLLGLNVGPHPHHGAPTTVNVAHYAFRSPADDFPFTTTAGPSMRHVVDMGNLDGAGGFVIGTGQSGISFSRHYDDQLEAWSEGGLIPLPLNRAAVERRAVNTLILSPETEDDRRGDSRPGGGR